MHLDNETVDMVALGERQLTAPESEHIAACPDCAAELGSLRNVVATARDSVAEELVPPSAGVWQSIHSQLNLTQAVAADPLVASPETHRGAHRAVEVTPVVAEPPVAPAGRVTPIGQARGASGLRRWLPVAAAAMVIGIVAGVVGAQLWPTATEQVLASATLEPFPSWNASGSAQLAEVDGVRELLVDLDARSGGLREVWLIDPETSGLLSLGLLDGATGQFKIPASVDLSRYSVVDISEEPNDGNPGHSGDSIVRGELRKA